MLYLSLFLFCFLGVFNPALWAGDTYFSSYLKLRGEYNDNITFSYYHPESDFLTIISPSLFLNYQSERLSCSSEFGLDVYDYMQKDRLNTINQRYKLNASYQWRNRWQFFSQGYIIKDTTLESELKETGIVRIREERRRYYLSAGVNYSLSELTQLGLELIRSRTEYDWRYNVDYNYYSASMTLQHLLKNQRDVLMSKLSYINIDSRTSNMHNYKFMLGWQRSLSPISQFTALAGVRYTNISYYFYYARLVPISYWPYFAVVVEKKKQNDEEWGYVADISFQSKGESASYRLGLNKDLSYSSFGEAVDRLRLYGWFLYKLTPRWSFLFSTSYYLTSSKGKVYEEDNIFYFFRPMLKYLLTERWSLETAYQYSDYRDKVRDHEYDRHQVWLVLTFEFGKPPASR